MRCHMGEHSQKHISHTCDCKLTCGHSPSSQTFYCGHFLVPSSHIWLLSPVLHHLPQLEKLGSRAHTRKDRSQESPGRTALGRLGIRQPGIETLFHSDFLYRHREILQYWTGGAVPGGLQTGGRSASLLLHPEHGGVLHEPQPSWAGPQRYQGHCYNSGGEHAGQWNTSNLVEEN